MLTMKECVERGYYSSALIYGSARNKWVIAKEHRNVAQNEQMKLDPESEEFDIKQKMKLRWSDLSTRLTWLWKFCDVGFGTNGHGVRKLLEDIYELLGEDKSNLVNFKSYDNLHILSPISFNEEPSKDIASLENEFEPEDDIFRNNNDERELYKTMFNYMLLDVYRFMAMGVWFDEHLDRDSVIGDDRDLILSIWDIIIEGAKNFLYQARGCFADSEIETRKFFDGEDEKDIKFVYGARKKFMDAKEDTLVAAGGLYKINYSKLPQEWKDKVTALSNDLLLS